MKRTPRLDRGYPDLAPAERFRLLVAADARCDEQEVVRLLTSCPRLTVSTPDPEFGGRLERAFAITTSVVVRLLEIEQRLNAIETIANIGRVFFVPAADNADFEASRVVGDETPDVRGAVRREAAQFLWRLRDIRARALAYGAALVHAFIEFAAEELEVEATDLVSAFARSHRAMLDQYLEICADVEIVAIHRAALNEAWQTILES